MPIVMISLIKLHFCCNKASVDFFFSFPPVPCEPGKLPFPPAPDLNTRLRRLVATCQRNHKRQQMKLAKREKVCDPFCLF